MAAISCTLLVDDDDTTNYLNQTLLRRMAISDTVLVAGNGQEALDLRHRHCALAAGRCPLFGAALRGWVAASCGSPSATHALNSLA